jgi:hypothetical protein
MNKTEQTAYRTKTIQVGNVVVTIHRPVLTESERAKRTEELVSALGRYGKALKEEKL